MNKILQITFIILLALGISKKGNAQTNLNFKPVYELIQRKLPTMVGKVKIVPILNAKKDTANFEAKQNSLIIKASSLSSAFVALNQYLNEFCNSSFSHTGNNVQLSAVLPNTNKLQVVSSKFPIRYALNYCTLNYTMSFWDWEDWEKELDWMALNGVNLMLAPIGVEEVWQKTLVELGYSKEDIGKFIPGPAFNAWWLMANLEGWGGPISDAAIEQRTLLQKKLLKRMKELSIEPVVQAFWGMIPSNFNKYFPEAKVIDQGYWCGFKRPSVLAYTDPLFQKVSAIYYKNFKALFGSDFKYLAGDPFHEGGKTANIDLTNFGTAIQADMGKYFPNSIWVLQGWQDNPKEALLKGLDKKKTLILDLLGDNYATWENRNSYNGIPWVWTTITNYGGKTTLEGKLLRTISEPLRASNIDKNTIAGVGIIPEGIDNNDIVYKSALKAAWMQELPELKGYLSNYVKSRYGKNDESLIKAWELLLQSVYQTHNFVQQGGYESIFCARPDTLKISTISCCGPLQLPYDKEILYQAAANFSKNAKQYQNVASYQFDLVDIYRQLLSLKGREAYDGLMLAYKQKNKAKFAQYKKIFTELLLLQNDWLGANQNFMVGNWIEKAKNAFTMPVDKLMAEKNARTQISFWGPDQANTMLHEYAAKEWNGILKDLYLKRWLLFFDYIENRMEGKKLAYPMFFDIEKDWANATNKYPNQPSNQPINLLDKVKKVLSINIIGTSDQKIDFFSH